MFNFKKKETAPKEVLVVDYPEIVHTIHREFNTAGEKLLQEAEAILADCKLKDKEKGKLLNALGFKNTPQAKEAIEIERKEKEAENNAKLVNYYSQKYPLNKFITEDVVKKICEKYGLVCGGVSLYKGFVPQNKLQQISEFNLKDDDKGVAFDNGMFLTNAEIVNDTTNYFHIYKKGNRDWSKSAFQSNDGIDWYSQDKANTFGYKSHGNVRTSLVQGNLEICAPEKDMDTSNHRLSGFRLIKNIPDPVVLCRVNGGYLIVTAWGNEASDENIVNQKMN